jgi:hypothetical protein
VTGKSPVLEPVAEKAPSANIQAPEKLQNSTSNVEEASRMLHW